MEGLTGSEGVRAPESAEVLLASTARERTRAVSGLERLALGALSGCAVAAGVALFAFPAARAKQPPEAFRAAGTALPFLAMIFILAASRLRGMLLNAARRQAKFSSSSVPDLIAAYRRAIRIDFILLEMVAWLGVAMVPLTGSVRYALVLIVVAILGMAVRWPRLPELDRLAR
ncbi:MAG TPA: hypothetical protein VN851_09190 [Thermoanaerobaculia bacterium]|nr:hypothetical protein [Thermoanaerobaculia bacterium]